MNHSLKIPSEPIEDANILSEAILDGEIEEWKSIRRSETSKLGQALAVLMMLFARFEQNLYRLFNQISFILASFQHNGESSYLR